ncbi:voltage-gated sodium channel [Ruminococcaceae bacterium YAD3003]|nr:voltage-gated sodium channel [Ruminococcaceae bacterium YAD3003]
MIKGLKKIVDGKVFQGIILFVILFNCVLMGIETIKGLSEGTRGILATINNICLWIFIAEIVIKLLAYGLDYFKDPWNWFDMFIVGISMASGLPFMAAFRAMRVLRVLKSLKALRGTKLIGSVKHLQVIIGAIVKSVPSILWTGILLILIYYVFSLIGVNLFGDAFPDWFGTIGKAMYTLFQVMTLESWSMGISRPVMEVYSFAWAYFVPFVLLSSFVVMNVVVGIVVNAISEVTAENNVEEPETKEVSKEDLLKEMREVKEQMARLEKALEKTK